MRELLLLRHAKSSWEDPALEDFDRPLAERGERAAPRMGREIAARGWVPDRALVSSALRTRQTWRLVGAELGEAAPVADYDYSLYMASADVILKAIRTVPENVQRLLVLGHNPGLEEFARMLAGPGSKRPALRRIEEKFPTAALARFEFEGPWPALGSGGARLTHFLRPRDFAS
ncbi:histidine phosphatase family protein [Chelativorans sp. AA-79]|uniref:SixA phosphatase family protein n=1 Tax=Chelativorans sp. AA-79 TaxID=3028735 RepID=UPI0023F7A538|nr:histidine phosphatase family protein [Chelativorans sp. AA-79]WEX07860.1 histidine phosphatase family protein [Chelativorans sp. AA-79]